MKNDEGLSAGNKCWDMLIQILLRRLSVFLRSKSYLRSRPDLLSKLTPTPSGPQRTIQPLSLTSLCFVLPWITRLILSPNEILLPVSTKAPPRLMLVTSPLMCRYLNVNNNGLLQGLLGCFLESFSACNLLFCGCCFSNLAISITIFQKIAQLRLNVPCPMQNPCKTH